MIGPGGVSTGRPPGDPQRRRAAPDPRPRHPHRRHAGRLLQRLGAAGLHLLAVCAVVRAAAEPFVIDVHDPATYAGDRGGPHLAGVLAVHCLPGLLALVLLLRRWTHRHSASGGRSR